MWTILAIVYGISFPFFSQFDQVCKNVHLIVTHFHFFFLALVLPFILERVP